MDGGCLCGAIRYCISGTPLSAEYCHCRMCQKVAGAAFANWLDLRVEQLQWLAENPVEYQSSEHIRRGFCGTCGSTLSFRSTEHPKYIGTTIASLDNPNLVEPSLHIYVESQVAWLSLNDSCDRYTRERKKH